jgi:hypothetical protein
MNYPLKKQLTSLLLILSMVGSPIVSAYADDYAAVCSNVKSGTSTSDQTKAYCDQARSGKIAKGYNVAKEVVMTVATAALVIAGATGYGSALCPAISYGASAAGMGLDIVSSIKLKNVSSALIGTLTTVGTTLATSKTSISDAFAKDKFKNLNQSKATDAKAQKSACFTAAVSTGIQAVTAELGRESSKKAEDTALQSVKDLVAARNGTGSGFVVGGAVGAEHDIGNTAKSAAKDAVADDTGCSSENGNNYLKCLGKNDAQIAAITNSPDAMNALESNLGGKSLGDVVKDYKGNSSGDLANYVANAMGAGSTGADALSKALDASKTAAIDSDLYKPGSYVASNNKTEAPAADMDFNKMMESMLKSLNPDGTDKKAGEDPSLIVFRKLDLLPADKIEANKDISLFARIGYRYRKKSEDVEHLNWATESNQAATARAPASTH